MEIRLLGPVEVWVDGCQVDLGPPKRRAVLALLAMRIGVATTIEQLIDFIWDDSPPDAARRVVIVHVSRLRAALLGVGIALETSSAGYVLTAPAESIDAHRFRAEVTRAGSLADVGQRSEVLGTALALWRGPALFGIGLSSGRDTLAAGLERLRMRAVEHRIAADLELGRHADLEAELAELVAQHPTHEQFSAQRMLAALGAGRRTEALEEYERLRLRLADDLGVDPGVEVQDVFRKVLRAGDQAEPERVTVPKHLPSDVRGFRGRDAQLARLDDLHSGGAGLVVVSGMGGVGKTALVVRWAHRRVADFPDGQLYANGYAYAGSTPLGATGLLTQFLRALGVPNAEIPLDVGELQQAFRTAIAGRRMLIVVDNVADPELIRAVSPGTAGSLLLVTSRDRLMGVVALDSAASLRLGPLGDDDAEAVLHAGLPDWCVRAEPTAAAALAQACGGLPLALRIAAANFDADHDGSLESYHAAVTAAGPLAALRIDGDARASLGTVFSWSYDRLPPTAARAFRLLGAQPLREWDRLAAAAVLDVTPAEVDAVMPQLVRAHLLDQSAPGSYAMHDLLRDYAASLAGADADGALRRLLSYYRAATHVAMDAYLPQERRRRPASLPTSVALPDIADATGGLAWLNVEADRVVTLVHAAERSGHARDAIDLTYIVHSFLFSTSMLDRLMSMSSPTMRAAQAIGDPAGEGLALQIRGRVELSAGQADAEAHLLEALAKRREAGDVPGTATTLGVLGSMYVSNGRAQEAFEALEGALDAHTAFRDTKGQAATWNSLAFLHRLQGRLSDAADCLQQALRIAVDDGNSAAAAAIRANIGAISMAELRYPEALRLHEEALENARGEQKVVLILAMLNNIGRIHLERGHLEKARAVLVEAQELARTTNERIEESWTVGQFGRIELEAGNPKAALRHLEAALFTARTRDIKHAESDWLYDIGRCRLALDDTTGAEAAFTESRDLAVRIEAPDNEAVALAGLAMVALARGQVVDAVQLAQQGAEIAVRSGMREAEIKVRRYLAEALHAAGRHDEAHAQATEVRAAHIAAGFRDPVEPRGVLA